MRILKKIWLAFCTPCTTKRGRTVRYAFPVVASALALLGALAIGTSGQTEIRVTTDRQTVQAGESIAINVSVSAQTPINAVDLSIRLPSDQLEVTGIDTGESVITLWTETPYEKDGVVYLRGGTFRKGFLGEHLIATINAKAVATGIATVTVKDSLLLAGDGAGTEVKPATGSGQSAELYIAGEDGVVQVPSTLEGVVEIRIYTDIDGDGTVSLNDISQFMAAWRSQTTVFDFSGDGKMTFTDFAIILSDAFFR